MCDVTAGKDVKKKTPKRVKTPLQIIMSDDKSLSESNSNSKRSLNKVPYITCFVFYGMSPIIALYCMSWFT